MTLWGTGATIDADFSHYIIERERKENYKNVEFLKLQEIFILTKKDDTYHNRMKAPDVHLLHT